MGDMCDFCKKNKSEGVVRYREGYYYICKECAKKVGLKKRKEE